MIVKSERKVIVLFEDSFLADLVERVDRLHTAASEGHLHDITTLPRQEVVEWLQEVIFTAEETIREISQNDEPSDHTIIRLLDRPEFNDRRSS